MSYQKHVFLKIKISNLIEKKNINYINIFLKGCTNSFFYNNINTKKINNNNLIINLPFKTKIIDFYIKKVLGIIETTAHTFFLSYKNTTLNKIIEKKIILLLPNKKKHIKKQHTLRTLNKKIYNYFYNTLFLFNKNKFQKYRIIQQALTQNCIHNLKITKLLETQLKKILFFLNKKYFFNI